MVILIFIGIALICYGLVQFLKAICLFGKAFYYKYLANEKQIDEGFKKHVIKQSDAYKVFEDRLNKKLRNGI